MTGTALHVLEPKAKSGETATNHLSRKVRRAAARYYRSPNYNTAPSINRAKLILPAKLAQTNKHGNMDPKEPHPHLSTALISLSPQFDQQHTALTKMKISWTFSLLYLAATAAAQATQLTELPQCAIGCFQQAVVETTSCNPTDTACLCAGDNTVKVEKRASGCVAANCEDSSGKWMDGWMDGWLVGCRTSQVEMLFCVCVWVLVLT
jgi:hypothetical protein